MGKSHEKTCVSCKRTKLQKKWYGGPTCSSCHLSVYNKKRPEMYEAAKERRRTWYKANKEKALAKCKEWRERNKGYDAGRKRQYMATAEGLFNHCRNSAKQRGLEFTITLDEFQELRQLKCAYCAGDLPKNGSGLDRIDNSKGYTVGNVVPCCTHCNKFRSNKVSYFEMKQIIALLAQMRGSQSNFWGTRR